MANDSTPFQTALKRNALSLPGVIWLGICLLGLFALSGYESLAGCQRASPAFWPQESLISRQSGKPALILFVHPHCPCSRATLGEFNALLARTTKPIDAHIVFYDPGALRGKSAATDLRKTAAKIPGVQLHADVEGREAVRFGAATSGHALFYDEGGKLRFSGGMTASRGHAGENEGGNALLNLVNGEAALHSSTPVFGCAIFAESSLESGNACLK